MKRMVLSSAAVGACIALAVSCGTKPPCGVGNCSGCCDTSGACQNGNAYNACGTSGGACNACGSSQVCQLGFCTTIGTTGGDGGNGFDAGTRTDGGPGSDGGNRSDGGHPNVLIVIDKSGSMTKPTDPTNAACQTGNPSCPICGLAGCGPCPASCPTRISELQSGLNAFLTSSGSVARFGLVTFPKPGGASCDATDQSTLTVTIPASDDPATLQANASTIASDVGAIVPSGGTPTAGTLANFASYTPLLDSTRADYVLLLTDGEPNCNASNPNSCTQAACNCTLYQGMAPVPGSCPGASCACGTATTQPACVIGCLDDSAAALAVSSLRNSGVKTFVVGLGLETLPDSGVGTGFAPTALQEMAQVGGEARPCPSGTNADCDAFDTCNPATHLCNRSYYLVLDSAQLQAALGSIAQRF